MSARVGVNLRASAFLHQGSRKYMEDECEVAYQRTANSKDIEYAYFGIFDGHGGKEAAIHAKDNLMDQIVAQRSFWSDDDEEVLSAIREGFIQTHHAMWRVVDQWPKTPSGWPSTSGTTATIAFIRRHKIYIGHVGDSGIVLGYDDGGGMWNGENLTQDHKPESIQEMTRITESGGKVVYKSGVPRVVWNRPKSGHQGPVRRSTPIDEIPFLAVARSLGDLWSYNANNNQFVVSPEPDVCVVDIDITRHRCLIFGTDGLWNALSPQAAVNIAYAAEKNNEIHYLGCQYPTGEQRKWINPSTSIVCGALERYKRIALRADNTSAITVYIDAPGKPKREVLLKNLQSETNNEGYDDDSLKTKKSSTVKVHMYSSGMSSGHTGGKNRSALNASTSDSSVVDYKVDRSTAVNCSDSSRSNRNTAYRKKDVQSPEVSSTTEVAKYELDTPNLKEFIKRRTRSSISPVKENDGVQSGNSSPKLKSVYTLESSNNRILKSVNRTSINTLTRSSSKVGLVSNKRKRMVEISDVNFKRIATRSIVKSAKSMVTRSQEKLRQTRK